VTEMKKSLAVAVIVLFVGGIYKLGNEGSASARPRSAPATPVPGGSRTAIPDTLGFNVHFLVPSPGELELIRDSGVRWVRMDFNWRGTERKAGVYDFSAYDAFLAALDQNRLKAVLILDTPNPLYDNGAPPKSDGAVQAFAQWAAAAVSHFKGRGVLWELWNEPESSAYPIAQRNAYLKLALATGAAIKAVAPNEQFMGPATAGAAVAYAVGCLQAGMSKYWTAVSIHPYSATPEAFLARVPGLTPAVAPLPLYSSEWGYSTAGGANYDVVADEQIQAKYLSREFLVNAAGGIGLSIWYDWKDDGADPTNKQHHFGVVHSDLSPKPAYKAAKTLTSRLDGYVFSKRLSPARAPNTSGDFVLAFEPVSGSGATRYVGWTTAPPHNVSIPVPSGRIRQTSHLGGALPDLTAGMTGLNVQLTDAPIYVEAAK